MEHLSIVNKPVKAITLQMIKALQRNKEGRACFSNIHQNAK